MLRLAPKPGNVAPPGLRVTAIEERKEGGATVVGQDDRWANFFFGCGSCGPNVLTFVTLNRGKYSGACRDHKDAYAASIRSCEHVLNNYEEPTNVIALEAKLS